MYIIGVSAYYHDSSACLFKNGELLFACEEEKFTGIKHDSSFPHKTIEYIFNTYKLSKEDIDCVCYYEDPTLRFKRKKSFFTSLLNNIKVRYNLSKLSRKIHYTPHHLSHMAYSYYSSNFNDAVVVSIDGVGETSTVSFGKGVGGGLKQLKTIEYPHSVGLFYSAMTAFLGFKPNEGEYKVMGLASYGNPAKYRDKVSKLIKYKQETLTCNMDVFVWDKEDTIMFNHQLGELIGLPNRLPNETLTQNHKDLAAAVQERYEYIFFKILKEAKHLFKSNNLCLGGGCAYNGKANGAVVGSGLFKHLWVPPAPSDAGNAIGSCLYYLSLTKPTRINPSPFLGPSYTDGEIYNALIEYKPLVSFERLNEEVLIAKIAKCLNNNLVVGWFKDRIEFGARALGNRSILANPTPPDMQDRINRVIKKREGFRPFAPMVAFENQETYFKSKEYVPYMNQVIGVRDEYKDKLLAVTHVDGTARVQSVTPYNKIYFLLKEFEKLSGYPILLNTSFNVKDKTMVLTPQDALFTFIDTEMDILVLGNYIVYKK
jgi:carbamoyltransferase